MLNHLLGMNPRKKKSGSPLPLINFSIFSQKKMTEKRDFRTRKSHSECDFELKESHSECDFECENRTQSAECDEI